MKRLLTIGHSYVVGVNRRLAHEMAIAGRGAWDVTAAAPRRYHGDLRTIRLEAIDGEACRVEPVSTRLDRLPYLTWYSGRLRSLLRQRWDVVHCWEEPYVLAAAQIARASSPEARFVFATFQNIPKRYPPPLAWFERRVLRRADGWIAFGHSVAEVQRQRNAIYAELPSQIIPPGVDLTVFRPDAVRRREIRRRLGWEDDVPVVGFVGRFIPAKGSDTLIAALERVGRPWRALFIGSGVEQRAVEAFAERRPGAVAVVTDVPHGQVPAWLNAMDVLCAPSRATPGWREQFGRMLIEAMACAVPVIASESGEIPHVVGDAGVLAPERDVAKWSEAIEALLASPGRRVELGARGMARVRERFTWQAAARRHLDFFDELT